ncbi:MAG TPA: Uma2 family endonuclease [Polyangia bacterium]
MPRRGDDRFPRAPSDREWAALSEVERARVVESLPAELSLEEFQPEGDPHIQAKLAAFDALRGHFGKLRRPVYLAMDLTVYYPAERRFAPDLLAVLDVDPRPRMKWVVSAEGKGLDFVLEVHVRGKRRKDHERNVAWYAALGIREYFAYDRGRQRLAGWRLPRAGGSAYEPVPEANGRLASAVLGLELTLEGEGLRFYQGTAALLEERELRERLEVLVSDVQRRADAEARRAREEARRAEEEARRAEEAARRAVEEARRGEQAEQRVAELTRELERLRSGG